MRRFVVYLVFATLWVGSSWAGTTAGAPQAAPQTARQALIEMFFSKTPGTLIKHLPVVTRAALEKSGALASLQQYSTMATQLQTQGQNVQTFETGSVLLSGENPKTGDKVEITVENDALRGDQDDIEVSFQTYKNGVAKKGPFMPQITFSMKQEAEIWTLNEISVTIHLPLADPDFLKAITEKMTPQAGSGTTGTTSATGTFVPRSEVSAQAGGSDAMVVCRHANDSYGRGDVCDQLSGSWLQLHTVGPGWFRKRSTERASGDADQQWTGEREAVSALCLRSRDAAGRRPRAFI